MPRLVLGRRPGQRTRLVVPPSDQPIVIEIAYENREGQQIGLLIEAPHEVTNTRPDARPRKEPKT